VGESCVVAKHGAHLGPGASIAVGALVHARTFVPDGFFVPPHTLAAGDPARVITPDQRDEAAAAVRDAGFAAAAFGVGAGWADRLRRYEAATEARSAEFAAHRDDEPLTPDPT
jgi:carbonic anhydrase/acetyltransferase-like protein (isoleucine patch superfamily)